MRRFSLVAAAAAALCGCGYVGDPLPPALNLASRITDLRVTEYGSNLLVEFTIPPLTTDNLPLKKVKEVDLRIGPGSSPFDQPAWEAAGKQVPVASIVPGPVHASVPVTEYIGREVVLGVRISNTRGRSSAWSNLVVVTPVPPVAKPEALKADSDPAGVRLTWSSPAPKFRVFRQAEGEKKPALLGSGDGASYVDKSAEYGKAYQYLVQAVTDHAESEISSPVSITPRDTFAPGAPAGLIAVAGNGTIELVWDRNTEPDLKGYRVYRAVDGGQFVRIAEMVEAPSYSDKQIEAGKKYSYAVTAVDQSGNESSRSVATP